MASVDNRAHKVEVCLAGAGGQGIILLGILLAEAAGVHEGKQVVQMQAYGPQSRGGRCRADVIISDERIDFPEVEHPHVLLALTQEAASAFAPLLRRGGTMVVDSGLVHDVPAIKGRVFALPVTELAVEHVGRALFANIVALGALTAITGTVSAESVRRALERRVPKGTEAANQRAFDVGYEIGATARTSPPVVAL
jgi:2-oxoglutarate ferredoxin oxidoreductase subunit gamma